MAGLSNAKFLAPSYFIKSDGNTTEKITKNTALQPPSTYEKHGTDKTQKSPAEKPREVVSLETENTELRKTIAQFLEEKRHGVELDQSVVEKSRREESLQSELHLAKRMVGNLEQEKEILEYELQDTEALSNVVLKLKKELRKAKERISTKDKAMVEKTKEYSETLRRLRSEIKAAESVYSEKTSSLKGNCTKYINDVRELNMENNELQKQLEEKRREFEAMLCEKEQEKYEFSEKLNKYILEKGACESNVEKLEDVCKVSEEGTRKLKMGNEILKKELTEEKEKCLKLRDGVLTRDSSITNLQDRMKVNEENLDKVDTEYQNKVKTLEKESGLNVKKLEGIIQSKEERFLQQHQIHSEKLQVKEDEIKELIKSVEQLRSYIGEIRPSQDAQKLSEVNTRLTDAVQVLSEENNTLHSTLKLLNIRLSSILEIVAIQEKDLTRSDDLVGTPRDSEGLLRKWREKVFALMVQLRCQKIVESDQKRKDSVKLNNLNTKLENLEREHCVLSHKLTDKEATLELEVNLKKTKSQELENLEEKHEVLKNQQTAWLTQFQTLCHSTQVVEKTLMQSLSNFKKVVSKMALFDQRIKFAGSRIQFISEFLTNRDSQQKAKLLYQEKSEDNGSLDGDTNGDAENHLKNEVEKLLRERTTLLNETKKHNDTLREKTLQITQEFQAIIEEKNERIEKLETFESDMKEKMLVLQENLETKNQELEEASESIEELKLTLTKQKAAIEKAHRETFEKERLGNIDDMRNLEGQLNDVRREHAKAVSALKNAERQVSREKENASKMVSNIEREFNEKLSRCEKQLKNAEKERNLLMVKIREDKNKVPRLRPLMGHDKAPAKTETNVQSRSQSSKPTIVTSGTQGGARDTEAQRNIERIDPNEAFAALKELKILSEQIVKMHGDHESSISDSEY